MNNVVAAAGAADVSTIWVVLRTTGIMAVLILTLGTVIGIASPGIRDPRRRLTAISMHSAAAAAGTVLLLAHIALAVADSYIKISPAAVVVPGLSEWQPLWVGVGTVSFDLMLLIVLTSLNRLRAPRLWRRVHLASYVALALAWAHALFVGTDASSRPMQLAALISVAAVGLAVVFRQSRAAQPVIPTQQPSEPKVLQSTATGRNA